MHPKKLFTASLFVFLCSCFHNVLSTEISEASPNYLEYLGQKIGFPVLLCHPKHSGYKKVIWKKDFTNIVKTGSADLSSHMLPVLSLLDLNSSALDTPFKLQGYYRCETDVSTPAYIHDYLFQTDSIYTYVGKILARKDSLGKDDKLSLEAKLSWKMRLYEREMKSTLFAALPNTNIYVTDMKVLKNGGLEVHFYLYVRDAIQPRNKIDTSLVADEEHYLDIIDHLYNETTDEGSLISKDWIGYQGINFEDIDLRSTLGCYTDVYPGSINTTEQVTWPSTRIGDVAIPDNVCLTKNGLAVTRLCTGSFHSGAKWGLPSGDCERPPNEITLQFKDVYDNYGRTGIESKIEKLIELTEYPSELTVSDLHFVADILKRMSETDNLKQREISGILSVIDRMMETNKTELDAAKNIIRLTSRFLQLFGNILKQANENDKEIKISKQHLMVDTIHIKEIDEKDVILGLAVHAPDIQDTLYNGSVTFLLSSDKLPKHGSVAHFALPKKMVQDRVAQQDVPRYVNMVFFQNWNLFQNPKGVLVKRNYRVLPGPVMYVSVSSGPAWNLTDPIQLYFKDTVEEEIENPVCVYYDEKLENGAGAWSSEGCEFRGLKYGYYQCQCHHLSIFAVILSESPYSIEQKLNLGSSIYVGCGVSILALSVSVLLFILSKSWRKTIDQCILFCLLLTFLACIIIIFISEMHFKRKLSCILLAMIFHYTIFATFGWLLVLAVIYRLRFAMKTDVSEIPHFMIKAALSVWIVPIIIVIVIWFAKDFTYSVNDGCLLTVYQVTKASIIPVIILINVTLCINICATYSLTCRYRKDFVVDDAHYNDDVVKFRVAFTIFSFFVLSWLFGFLAAYFKSKTLKILFSIAITLTAYYVSLFFIFQEISFWELCKNCKQKEAHDAPVAQYNVKRYKSNEETTVKQ